MRTYYITTEDQFGPQGYAGTVNGVPVYAGDRNSYLFDLETRASDCIVAKAVDAGARVRATLDSVIVSFAKGSVAGDAFKKSVEETGYRSSALIRASVSNDVIMYEFKRSYALGGR